MKAETTSNGAGAVQIAPTLDDMSRIYQLSREGGPKSERFNAYVALAGTRFGFSPWNPMAGDAALDTVDQLLKMDAERVARESAVRAATMCEYAGSITLAIAVRSKGMWTDRVATEVDERVTGKTRKEAFGIISMWSREEFTIDDLIRESIAETVRVMWHSIHGVTDTLMRVLTCEGLAYALHQPTVTFRPHQSISAEEIVAVSDAIHVLGDSRLPSDIGAILYGDDVAREMGYTPLGLPPYAGYRFAVHRMRERLPVSPPASVLLTTL